MSTRTLIDCRPRLSPGLQQIATLLFGLTLLPASAYAQSPTAFQVAETISDLKSGYYGTVTPEQIEQARTGQLLPLLRDLFARSRDLEEKAHIASTLVRLGNRDNAYWNFLADYARPALESDAPSPAMEGPPEQLVAGHTPAWNTWASAHQGSNSQAGEAAIYNLFTRVQWLAASRDPRQTPLLRKALLSPNSQIVLAAADGLVDIRDKGSIPLIIEACRRAPPYLARSLAATRSSS